MASLYLLIPVSLIFCALAIAIFFWAVNNGQYDDLDAEGERLLFADESDEPMIHQVNEADSNQLNKSQENNQIKQS